MNRTVCVFCGQRAGTREHLFPVWTHEHAFAALGIPVGKVSPSIFVEDATGRWDSHLHKEWTVDSIDFQTHGYCRTCNNGWMSALEGRTQRALMPLILGQPSSLNTEDQTIVSTWAWKTAMVFDVAGQLLMRHRDGPKGAPPRANHPRIPRRFYRHFYESQRVHDDVLVWTGMYSGSCVAFGRRNTYKLTFELPATEMHRAQLVTGTRPQRKDVQWFPVTSTYFIIAFSIGCVAFRVLGPVKGDMRPAASPRKRHPFLIRLHPHEDNPAVWPRGDTILDDDNFALLTVADF